MEGGAPRTFTVTLDAAEWQFLIAVLRASTGLVNALLALGHSMPDALELPITPEAVANMMILADRIEEQTRPAAARPPTD